MDSSLSPVDSAAGPIQSYYTLTVGAGSEGSSNYQGLIDEVRIYDFAVERASFARILSPFCPLKLGASITDMVVNLSWTDQSENSEGTIIERKTRPGEWEELVRLDGEVTHFADTVDLYDTQYSYLVRAYNTLGISGPSLSKTVTSPSEPVTGLPESHDSQYLPFSAYPNPFHNTFTLDSPVNVTLKIYNLYGSVILSRNGLSGNEQIDLSGYPDGMYILSVGSGDRERVSRIVKASQNP